jgi:hypothetical protein
MLLVDGATGVETSAGCATAGALLLVCLCAIGDCCWTKPPATKLLPIFR